MYQENYQNNQEYYDQQAEGGQYYNQSEQNNYDSSLAYLLATIIDKELEIEQYRILLCENVQFECSEAFKCIDLHRHGYLTANDFKIFLSKNHIITREKEVEFLVYNYSKSHKYVTFKEFLKILLPNSNDTLREQCLSRHKFYPSSQRPQLPFYLEEQLSKIFELEINYIRETETQKMDLMNNFGWNFRESFRRIARIGQDFIDKQAFYAYMVQNQYTDFSEKSFKNLLVRFNQDGNDIITMDEFCLCIFPSDFLNINNKQKIKSAYNRYVKGSNEEFNQFIKSKEEENQREQYCFQQEDQKFENNIDKFEAQQKREGVLKPKKFLKTSIQYENNPGIKISQNKMQEEELQDGGNYPILNQFLINKKPQNGYQIQTNSENQYSSYNQNQYNSHSQQMQFLDYDKLQQQQQIKQQNIPNLNSCNLQENKTSNSFYVKSQMIDNSKQKPIGINASTVKFLNQSQNRQQLYE